METMKCKHCGETKPLAEMMKDSRPKMDGSPSYYATCKPCKSAQDIARLKAYKKTCACCKKEKHPSNFETYASTNCRQCASMFNVENKTASKALAMRW